LERKLEGKVPLGMARRRKEETTETGLQK